MPTIEAIAKLVSGSFPVLFPVHFRIKFVYISFILLPVTDLMFTVQYLRPEWGKGAIGQDGQVTILDLPKAHGIPYLEVSSLLPCILYFLYSLSLHATQMMEISNLTFSQRGWQGNTIPLAWSTFWVHLSGQILMKPNRSMQPISKL